MQTVITVINTVQVGIDTYQDIKTSRIFNDDSTIREIKERNYYS